MRKSKIEEYVSVCKQIKILKERKEQLRLVFLKEGNPEAVVHLKGIDNTVRVVPVSESFIDPAKAFKLLTLKNFLKCCSVSVSMFKGFVTEKQFEQSAARTTSYRVEAS